MFSFIKDFESCFLSERVATQKIFAALTDATLEQQVGEGFRSLKRLGWHIVQTYPEMMKLAGLTGFSMPADAPLPDNAAAIIRGYDTVSRELLEQIKSSWSDATLHESRDFYGEQWKLGAALMSLVTHEIHHRAQMTVLMRQAGLKVPGIYGPSKDEWAAFGASPPEV